MQTLSHFATSLGVDVDAFKADLTEFVSTVKDDTSRVLEDVLHVNVAAVGKKTRKESQRMTTTTLTTRGLKWDVSERLVPEALCSDPVLLEGEGEWKPFTQEEVDALLGDEESKVPELYRVVVPSRATHGEFFKRLAYWRSVIVRDLRKVEGEEEEEDLGGWDDDREEEEDEDNEDEDDVVASVRRESATEIARLKSHIADLERRLSLSESRRVELEGMLSSSSSTTTPPTTTTTTTLTKDAIQDRKQEEKRGNENDALLEEPEHVGHGEQPPVNATVMVVEDSSSSQSWEEARAEQESPATVPMPASMTHSNVPVIITDTDNETAWEKWE